MTEAHQQPQEKEITKAALAAAMGVSPATVAGWMSRYLTNGVEYYVIGHTSFFFESRVRECLRAKAGLKTYVHPVEASKSGSSGAKSASIKKASTVTPIAKLTLPPQLRGGTG
jgi:hypothetical protein